MTTVSAVGSTPWTASAALARQPVAEATATPPSTVLQLGRSEPPSTVYDRPTGPTRSWASAPGDAISSLMQRNAASGTGSLASQWRGLGGALLTRLAEQGGDYRQTLVQHASGVAASDALASARDSAVTLQLRIRTQSGTTVELSIAVNRGSGTVQNGLQVDMRSNGALSDAERQALGALAEGFDKALAGLGRADAPQLDLSGLLAYDDEQLSSLELTVRSPQADDPLRSFSLQANAREKRIDVQGSAGDVSLRLDAAAPLAAAAEDVRQASIAQYLAQFDAAADRGHIGAELVAQLRQAFAQLHGANGDQAQPLDGTPSAVQNQVAPLLNGLADFELRIEGESRKTNQNGYLTEVSQARYAVAQQTSVQRTGATGDITVTQTRSAVLQAQVLRALGEAEIDLKGGNYHRTDIDDESRGKTTVATVQGRIVRADAERADRQLLTYAKLLNHRAVETHSEPRERHQREDLLPGLR
ncbi:hypothetical protein GCM10007320_57380 [Pseudorhodoferax aquiterrae]|uniref:Flagellar hook-associated protein 2 n=1 Tax=Pseudorhodoferax aquiterrae TaxID=747304 RepID=A0ABQ3GD37_9BURK|nr:hypothetical protein [Pseudorhodoferax aquiterrae]GHD00182.1 hypothetical protein GCM10007320_57380 [Pseudorhodoferax aquiterrae]